MMESFKVALAIALIGAAHCCTVTMDAAFENAHGIWMATCSMDCNNKPQGYVSSEVMNGFKAYFESDAMTAEGFMACMSYNDKAITQCTISPHGAHTPTGACVVADQSYPEGFTKMGNNYFHLTETPLNYDQGKAECAKKSNSSLARVMNEAENKAIAAFMPKDLVGVLIGANDIDTEGKFFWTGPNGDSSSAVEWTNWNPPKEPNNVGNEDCVALKANKGFRWIDCKCARVKFPVLCQWTRPAVA